MSWYLLMPHSETCSTLSRHNTQLALRVWMAQQHNDNPFRTEWSSFKTTSCRSITTIGQRGGGAKK